MDRRGSHGRSQAIAERPLQSLSGSPASPVLFLEGQLALIDADYGEAVNLFRRILSRDPNLTRVRLELARALFLARDFDAARYHFEIALGQALEEPVRENIKRFLRAIQGRTSWFTISAVFGPDSNPTYATKAETIIFSGRPSY